MNSVKKTKLELKKLQENWVWSSSELKLAGISVPETLNNQILMDGKYTPFVRNKENKTETDIKNNDQSDDEEESEPAGSTAKPRGKRPRGKRTSLGSDFEFPKKNLR